MVLVSSPIEQFKSHKKQILNSVKKTLDSGQYILGKNVADFEKNFANFIGVKYAIGVANGTDGLELALRSLGVGYGDEVITVSHTAMATVSAIESIGAKPVFVDIENDYFCINTKDIEKNISKKTKAIICVHLYGQPANLKELKRISKRNSIHLIEDVSQAHGSKYGKKKLGSIGSIGCFSLYPTKNLGAIGDAGIVTTNNKSIAKKISMMREYGWENKFESHMYGRNSRLDEIQAGILIEKLKTLNKDNLKRAKIAAIYDKNLPLKDVTIPMKRKNSSHVYHLYVIRCKKRDKLLAYLKKNSVYAGIHYPIPIHKQKSYKKNNYDHLLQTELTAKNILSLPIYPELKISQAIKISKLVNKFYS